MRRLIWPLGIWLLVVGGLLAVWLLMEAEVPCPAGNICTAPDRPTTRDDTWFWAAIVAAVALPLLWSLANFARRRTGARKAARPKHVLVGDVVFLGVCIFAAVGLIIGVFLPKVEPAEFTVAGVRQNSLIQSGEGWALVGLAVSIAAASYRAYRTATRNWTGVLLGLAALGIVIWAGTSDDALTLCREAEDGTECSKGFPDIGIYVAGVAAGLALLGSFRVTGRADADMAIEATKRCPDCAEQVLAAARVCRYCGFRFGPD